MYCTCFIVYLEETITHRLQTFPDDYLGRFQQFYVKVFFHKCAHTDDLGHIWQNLLKSYANCMTNYVRTNNFNTYF